ncbi:hypothetical protein [Flavilitoribacter nigricans]|uniref:DUF3575 domain-containing protein n=1 Tax=Flavilitoribacter nigricans (strain ATCC 23147 / DSM 23189 / NBRC 102662 / NCIMB 1420 / SS-2) TaxID=1122177 RepID=A0A2D0N719_FLAN2|nr:hypothetical protein [Flavilitoribacter nigricans]PHN04186.1 hypothetical protein CRP01_23620 [Flavilitoribacter nigricans DSM 23189 = NBRC 102662]
MKTQSLLLVLALIWGVHLSGQNNPPAFVRWQLQTNAGIALPLAKLKTGAITDLLIDYDDQYVYWQFITANYFFASNWGLSVTIQGNPFTDPNKNGERLLQTLAARYEQNYLVTSGPFKYGEEPNINTNIYLGVVYRKDFNKISLIPKLQIGATSFYAKRSNVYLKEINRNNHLQITYQSNRASTAHDGFTVMTGLTLACHLGKRFTLDLHTQLYGFITQFSYTEQIRNTYTEAIEVNTYDYDRINGTFSVGLGIGYKFAP